MVLESLQSIHLPPGTVGLVVRLGTDFVKQAVYEKQRLHQRRRARQRLLDNAPEFRLHISGERYMYVVH